MSILLEELTERNHKAFDNYEAMRKRWETRQRELRAEADAALQKELGAEYQAAQDERWTADKLYRAERERVDVERVQSNLPMPEGTVVEEWLPPHYDWNTPMNRRRTGRRGVVQIKRSTDDDGEGCRRHDVPAVGSVVVRIMIAGDKTGKRVDRFVKGIWLKEGELHAECQQRPCVACGQMRPADGAKADTFRPGNVCPHCGA